MDIGKAFEVAFNRKKEKDWEKIYVVVDIHDTILRALWAWWCHYRNNAGCIRLQTYPQPHLPLHSLCVHLHQRIHYFDNKLKK